MNIEGLAADALLERGAGLKIPAPFLFRLIGRKYMTIHVKRLYLGSLLYLSRISSIGILTEVDVGNERKRMINIMGCEPMSLAIQDIEENTKELSKAVACCILNNRLKIKLFSWWLSRVLRNRCHADQLQEIVMWLFVYGRIESFKNTTELIYKMSMTHPRYSGQIKRS